MDKTLLDEKIDIGELLVRDAIQQIKSDEGKAYAYKKEQVTMIANILKKKYNIETISKFVDFYYVIERKEKIDNNK